MALAVLCPGHAGPANGRRLLAGRSRRAVFGREERVLTTRRRHALRHRATFGLGSEELVRVNPGVDPWLPRADRNVVIPGQRMLPSGPRDGIVVNLPEHRLYFYPKPVKGQPQVVYTYPVSIGKMDWHTPLGKTQIVDKREKPTWTPPESVRKEHIANGEPPLPAVVPAGPDNPLGDYAMRLGLKGSYLIHGTNNPTGRGHGRDPRLHPHVSRGHRRAVSHWWPWAHPSTWSTNRSRLPGWRAS